MQIAATKTTVRDLLALLVDANPSDEVSFTRATKKATATSPCWCGCGGTTKSKFVPGHDSRFHGLAKRVARGLEDHETATAALPHEEARIEFERHVAKERPNHEAKEAAKAQKARDREAARAQKKAGQVGRVVLAAVSDDAEIEDYFEAVA